MATQNPNPSTSFLNQPIAQADEIVRTPGGLEANLSEVGRSGTYIFNGIITQEEYNGDLVRQAALAIWDKMRRGDGTISAVLQACKLPIIGASWTIEPGSDSAQDQKIANFISQELMGRNISFSDFMREGLTMFDFGYSVFEKVLEFVDFEGQQLIGLAGLHSRKQRSVYYWETQDHEPGITQVVIGGSFSIPRDKLVIFTNNKEGDNYEGISLLRAAYKHWQIKDKLYLIDAIRHERQGLGIVGIKSPVGAHQTDIDQAVSAARNIRANEEAYLKIPQGWEIEFMDMKANTTTNVMETVMHHDRQISKSMLLQFLELGGSSGSGSRAVGDIHSKLFMQSEEAAAKAFATTVQNDIIKYLVDLNFSGVTEYPKLEHSKIGDDDVASLADAAQKLMSVNALTPDADMEQSFRTAMHLPDLPDDYRNDYPNRPKASAAAPTAAPSTAPGAVTEVDASKTNKADVTDVSASARAQAIQARDNLLKAIEHEYAQSAN